MKYEEHNLNTRRLPFIFRCDTMCSGEKDFTHWHENLEILCFLEGEGRVICDFRREEVHAGDIYIINSEKLHMVESDDRIRYYCLIPDTDFCESNGIPVSTVLRTKIRDPQILEKYRRIAHYYESDEEFRETKIRIAVLELLLAIAEGHTAPPEERQEQSGEPHLQNIKEAIRYIKIHFQESITVDDAARAAGLSKAYFSREFRKITGFTMVSYLNLVRCQYACKLLRSGRYHVNEIAADSGFENMSYFTRTYKKIMGVLPSKEKQGE